MVTKSTEDRTVSHKEEIKEILIDFKLKTFSQAHFQYCMSWSKFEGFTSEQRKWIRLVTHPSSISLVFPKLVKLFFITTYTPSGLEISPIFIPDLGWLRSTDLPTQEQN